MFCITDKFATEVHRWKKHYGLGVVGLTDTQFRVVNGLDVYKHVSSLGIDLELMLFEFNQHQCVVDWIGFAKSATTEGWFIDTIISKVSYPIQEVYDREYKKVVIDRIKLWFAGYMNTTQSKEG